MAIGPDFVVAVSTASFLLCSMQLMCLICDWRSNDVSRLPVACSHTLMVPSRDPVIKNWSPEVSNMHMTAWVWPVYVCRQVPVSLFQAFSWSLAQCAPANTRRLLSSSESNTFNTVSINHCVCTCAGWYAPYIV